MGLWAIVQERSEGATKSLGFINYIDTKVPVSNSIFILYLYHSSGRIRSYEKLLQILYHNNHVNILEHLWVCRVTIHHFVSMKFIALVK